MNERDGDYAGFVTRAIAFAIDAAIINLVAATVAVVIGLGMSVLNASDVVVTVAVAVGGVAYVLWSAAYFATFWSTTGQTPGSRVMGIRIIGALGEERLRPRRALARLAGMILAALPFFAGFLLILVDDRRRGLQDRLARTLVVYVPAPFEEPRPPVQRSSTQRKPVFPVVESGSIELRAATW